MEKGKRLQGKSRIKHKRPAGTLRRAVLSSIGAKGLRGEPRCSGKKAPLSGADSPYQGEMSRRDKRGRDAVTEGDGEVVANLLQPLRLGVPPSHLPWKGRLLGVRARKKEAAAAASFL